MSTQKDTPPPRYDDAFKAGAVKMVTGQVRSIREVASELRICVYPLRSWTKASGSSPFSVYCHNHSVNCQKELDAEICALCNQLTEKDETITMH